MTYAWCSNPFGRPVHGPNPLFQSTPPNLQAHPGMDFRSLPPQLFLPPRHPGFTLTQPLPNQPVIKRDAIAPCQDHCDFENVVAGLANNVVAHQNPNRLGADIDPEIASRMLSAQNLPKELPELQVDDGDF